MAASKPSGPLAGFDQLLVAALFATSVAHRPWQQAQGEAGEEVEEAELQAAPAGQDENRARALGQLADLRRHCLRRQQMAGEGAGGVRILELVLQHRSPDAVGA